MAITGPWRDEKSWVYISGGMSGIEDYNYPAFDKAGAWLYEHGWVPVSPAELDREAGGFTTREASMKRDFAILPHCSAIAMLPGWEDSPGARLERAAAEAMGLDVYFLDVDKDHFEEVGAAGEKLGSLPTQTEPHRSRDEGLRLGRMVATDAAAPITILDEAKKLVYGNRQEDYGHPRIDFARTAKMVSAILGTEVRADQIPLIMIAVKVSRLCERYKRDSVTDLAGYAATLELVMED